MTHYTQFLNSHLYLLGAMILWTYNKCEIYYLYYIHIYIYHIQNNIDYRLINLLSIKQYVQKTIGYVHST